MPFTIDNPERPNVRVAKYGWRLLRPAGIGWIVLCHDDDNNKVDIETSLPVPIELHKQLLAKSDVEVLD